MPKISKTRAPAAENPPVEPEETTPLDHSAEDQAMAFADEEPESPAEESKTWIPDEYQDHGEDLTKEERGTELRGKTPAELRQILAGDYDLSDKGTKVAMVKRILAHEYPDSPAPAPVPVAGETQEEAPEAPPADSEGEGEPEAPATPAKSTRTRRERKTPQKAVASSADRLGALFQPLSEAKEFTRVLYYGREGSAKTTNLLTMANLGRVLFINAEGGVKKRALRKMGVNLDNVMVWPPDGEEITFEGLRNVYFQIKSDLEDDPDSWFGIGFDSVTDITQGILDDVSTHRVDKAKNRGITIDTVDEYFVDRDDYGTMSKMMRQLMRNVRDLPCHIVYTALERRDEDKDTGKVAYGPAMSPAVGTDLMGYVDMVLYCKAADEDQPVFRAASREAGKYRVKDRNNVLPRVVVNPTMERILQYVDEDLTEDQDEMQGLLVEKVATTGKKPTGGRRNRKPETTTENTKENTNA